MLDGLAIAIFVTKGYAKGYVYFFEQLLRLWLDLLIEQLLTFGKLAIAIL